MTRDKSMQQAVERFRKKNAKSDALPKDLVAAIIEAQADLAEKSPTECERAIADLIIAHLDSEASK